MLLELLAMMSVQSTFRGTCLLWRARALDDGNVEEQELHGQTLGHPEREELNSKFNTDRQRQTNYFSGITNKTFS